MIHRTPISTLFPYTTLFRSNKSKTYAKSIKSQVRKRLKNYDSIDTHPDLNSYGKNDNYEWRQYFLRDDETTLSKDRKSTRLNSSHSQISYAVFCLKKKKKKK